MVLHRPVEWVRLIGSYGPEEVPERDAIYRQLQVIVGGDFCWLPRRVVGLSNLGFLLDASHPSDAQGFPFGLSSLVSPIWRIRRLTHSRSSSSFGRPGRAMRR
jgi:hypothetical protein